jgi:hypothetical protein
MDENHANSFDSRASGSPLRKYIYRSVEVEKCSSHPMRRRTDIPFEFTEIIGPVYLHTPQLQFRVILKLNFRNLLK